MKILLMVVIVQSLNLLAFTWFNREAWIRILALRQQLNILQAEVEKASDEKQGSAVLDLALKNLGKLDI
jgi:hypothetical protein